MAETVRWWILSRSSAVSVRQGTHGIADIDHSPKCVIALGICGSGWLGSFEKRRGIEAGARRCSFCAASESWRLVQRWGCPKRGLVVGDSEIYEAVRWDLMRYATALVGPGSAEDVVSAVVTRVLARRGGLAGLRDPKPYLMRSVLNEVRSRHRVRSRQPWVAMGQDTVRAVDGPIDVFGVIERLPPRQRAAAFLVFCEEYTPTEAASVMDCRPATVRRYLHLARQKLREVLDE
jgi:RNA polymerase sigma-70 factor, ECF subfamily